MPADPQAFNFTKIKEEEVGTCQNRGTTKMVVWLLISLSNNLKRILRLKKSARWWAWWKPAACR